MKYQTVIYEADGGIRRLTLNRPQAGNTINVAMAQEIAEVCARINDDDAARVVVLSGGGDAFCRGAAPDTAVSVAPSLAGLNRPTIAALNGETRGQGLEIALACDIRLASANATFSLPQTGEGTIPQDGATQRLPRVVGKEQALEMLLLGETVDAAAALRLGLVSRVLPEKELDAAVMSMATALSMKAPIAMRYARDAVYQGMDMTLAQGLRLEADLYSLLQTTADRSEGIKAFREKREPHFRGE